MAVDLKYGRVTLERSTIADDEPVVVFRARDALLPLLLRLYGQLCEDAGSPPHHVEAVRLGREAVTSWQDDHPGTLRVPRSDDYGPHTATFGRAAPAGAPTVPHDHAAELAHLVDEWGALGCVRAVLEPLEPDARLRLLDALLAEPLRSSDWSATPPAPEPT